MKRIISVILAFAALFCTTSVYAGDESRYQELKAAGERVIQITEAVQERLLKRITEFMDARKEGYGNVTKEYWDKVITPELLQSHEELTKASELLMNTLPANFDPRKLKEPWASVYNGAKGLEMISLDKTVGDYDSEYLLMIIGCQDYLHLYASVFDGKYQQLERSKTRLQKIIADPDAYKQEVAERKKQQEIERKKKEEEEKPLPLRSGPIVPDPSLNSYHSSLSFCDVPLGVEFYDCIDRLKAKGFKCLKKQTEKHVFNGSTPVAFFLGSLEGYQVSVKVEATPLSYRVFEIEATLSGMIDEDEAVEEYERLVADFKGQHPNCRRGTKVKSQGGSALLEIMQNSGRVYKKLSLEVAGAILREYPDARSDSLTTGSCTVTVYDGMSNDYLVRLRFNDLRLDKQAYDESKKEDEYKK